MPPATLAPPYGNPTIDLSEVSVIFVSVPAPPSRLSLPLTPSLELSVSLPPTPNMASAPPPTSTFATAEPVSLSLAPEPVRFSVPSTTSIPTPVANALVRFAVTGVEPEYRAVSVPGPPLRVSLPAAPVSLSVPPWARMMSFPPAPFMVLLRVSPQRTSLPAVPRRGSLAALTVLVHRGTVCQSGFSSLRRVVSRGVLLPPLVSMTYIFRSVPSGDQAGCAPPLFRVRFVLPVPLALIVQTSWTVE